VFTAVLVADELNRTPPRTQSALLECMAEGSVTVDGETRQLPNPFFVIATQNPLTNAGTYPLPESQLDRFLMRITLGHPEADDEVEIVAREDGHQDLETIDAVADGATLIEARRAIDGIRLQHDLARYVVELARRTREAPEVTSGVSTRGAQALHRACRAHAWLRSRDHVIPDDVIELALPVLAHRIVVRGGSDVAEAILAEIVHTVPSPD
jgi:MoxR-like ATPase